MTKVNAAEMRTINGGTTYQCKVCASQGYKWTTRWWPSAVWHAWGWHPCQTIQFWKKW